MKLQMLSLWIATLMVPFAPSCAPSAASPNLIECKFGDSNQVFEINDTAKTVKDAGSDVEFKTIFYKNEIIKFSSDNPFYANDFTDPSRFPESVIITISRITGGASSQVFFKDDTAEARVSSKNVRAGSCRIVQRRF